MDITDAIHYDFLATPAGLSRKNDAFGQVLTEATRHTSGGELSFLHRKVVTGKLLRTFRQDSWINALAFAPDGQLLAAGDDTHTVKLWELTSGRLLRSVVGESGIRCVIFGPDGDLLATGDEEGATTLWNARRGELLRTFLHGAKLNSVSFASDGGHLATSGIDGYVRVWDRSTGRLTGQLSSTNKVLGCQFHSVERHLYIAEELSTPRTLCVSVYEFVDLTAPSRTP